MARVVRFHKVGGPEVLQIDNIEVPLPSAGEVRITIKALGLNRAESMYRSGRYLEEPKLPARPGYEASGLVDAVGAGVSAFKVGDAVSVVPPPSQNEYGLYGELANVPAEYVVKHPPTLSFVEAAAIWMQYITAYGALIDIARVGKGDFVAIPAASSSVGLAAIQLCNLAGATPIAMTRKSDKRQRLLEVGAAHVIAIEEERVSEALLKATNGAGARVVFDPVGGKLVEELALGMTHGGTLFLYGVLSPDPTPLPLFTLIGKGLSFRGYTLFEILRDATRFEKAKRYILDGLTSNKLKPIIAKTFTLDQIVEAHKYLESNQQIGKIVVTV